MRRSAFDEVLRGARVRVTHLMAVQIDISLRGEDTEYFHPDIELFFIFNKSMLNIKGIS